MKVTFAGGSHLVYEFYHDCCSCGICNLVGPGGEEFVRKPLPWAGAFVNSPGISMSDFERTPKRKISPAFVFLYVSVKSKLQHAPPPPGIPRALDTFAVPGRREFDRAFVANWLRGKGLNKLCAVFEVFKF